MLLRILTHLAVNTEYDILTETLRKVYGRLSISGLGIFTPDYPDRKESVSITKSGGIRFTGTYTEKDNPA